MKRFIASAWFPFCVCIDMAIAAAIAYALLQPTGEGVGNSEMVRIFTYAGWAVGPVMGVLSLIAISILNLVRRLFRVRQVAILHSFIVLVVTGTWFIWAWQLTGEPPYTSFARAVIEFIARPMLWGGLIGMATTVLLSLPLLFSKKA